MKIGRVGLAFSPIGFVITLLLVGAVVYVSSTWSPSSYNFAFNFFEVGNSAPVFGKPRAIRSDEWLVITPLTQATVNNGFARYNHTSPYYEDLRSVYSMPLADWGLLFKPDMWLYRIVNPAYAFSFHHYASFALFIIGYALLFSVIGISQVHACLLSLVLFFTGYVQYWWTALGPTFAIFPWLIVVLDWKVPWYLKLTTFYWIVTSWILAFFYPPTIISLAFSGFLILLTFRPKYLRWKVLIPLLIASFAAIATAGLYLQDYLIAGFSTIYPGQRITSGGGTQFAQWISQFFPSSQIHRHEPLLENTNICEISTVGTFYTLAVLCFLNYSAWKKLKTNELKRVIVILGLGLIAIWCWMFLPLPSWIGAPLLWNRIAPTRMFFASGLLLIIIIAVLAQQLGLQLTRRRVGLFVGLTLAAWVTYKLNRSIVDYLDLLILIPVVLVAFYARRLSINQHHTALLASALLVNWIAFGTFNPVQPAWQIFNRPQTAITQMLDKNALKSPDQTIAVPGFPGATLNGWGYRSISHVLPSPKISFFRRFFPALPEAELNIIFNRYAHIKLITDSKPKLLASDKVGVPISAFSAKLVPAP